MLTEYSIDFDHLTDLMKQPDAEPFNLLCHLAYNAPLRTRRERAEQVKHDKRDFFTRYGPQARAILHELLEKYTEHGGRAGVVLPNGTLFGDGVCARIKADLLKNFNLHTIVRLPNGVFAPYTSIPTNLLFFDRSKATADIWYYELPRTEGRNQYTKTKPLQYMDRFRNTVSCHRRRDMLRRVLTETPARCPRCVRCCPPSWTKPSRGIVEVFV